jgi:DNA-binding MarR family transcriptional regulator
MTSDELDPLIHVPTRLKIVATLAALPDGDALSFTRLQDMLGLTPGNLIIQLRKLEEAGYLSSEKTRSGSAQKTTVALTSRGRAALGAYIEALRNLLGGLDGDARAAQADSDHVAFRAAAADVPGIQGGDGIAAADAGTRPAARGRRRHHPPLPAG